MTTKNKSHSLFDNVQEGVNKDIFKTTVKITTFTNKEEKWVQHSYEEMHTNTRGRQLTSVKTTTSKTTCDSVERLENISSIIEALRDDDSADGNSQNEEENRRLKEINHFLKKSSHKKSKDAGSKVCSNTESLELVKSHSAGNEETNNFSNSSKLSSSSSTSAFSTSNFAKNTEENLRKELTGILLEVYLAHIKRSKDIDIKIFEKHINFCSESFNKKFNLYILQILTEKMSVVVDKIKDRVYKTNEVNILREKFYELKSTQENKSEEEKRNMANINMSSMNNTTNASSPGISGPPKASVDLNEKIRKVIKDMLIDLREHIYAVLEASEDIKRVFMPILLHLNDDDEFFNFEEIHREELAKAVNKDDFLKIIFLQIKVNAKNPSYEELYDILMEIEEILRVKKKEMTKFKNFIEIALEKNSVQNGSGANGCCSKHKQVKNGHKNNHTESKKFPHFYTCNNCISRMNGGSSTNAGQNSNHNTTNHQSSVNHNSNSLLNSSNPFLKHYCQSPDNCLECLAKSRSANSLTSAKKDKFKDIDDLLDYINSNEEEIKPKKTKKKNNKKEKKQISSQSVIGVHTISLNKEKMELEIEEFKKSLKNSSINAYSITKIRPMISRSWLTNLTSEVK